MRAGQPARRSRWMLPALEENRRRFFLPRRDEPTPILSLRVDDEPPARTVRRCGTRAGHLSWPARSGGPTPGSRRTLITGQVMFACGGVLQAHNSPVWRVRCSMSGLTAFVAVVPPGDIGRE